MKIKIAIVGATGLVGREVLKIIEERFPYLSVEPEIFLYATEKSKGEKFKVLGKELKVGVLTEEKIASSAFHIGIFTAGGEVSRRFAPLFAKRGAFVVDNSSFWRLNENCPLIIPEINSCVLESFLAERLKNRESDENLGGIIANPNCSTIILLTVLSPLRKFGIKRVVASTYQAVSGAGKGGINDLERGKNGEEPLKFSQRIFSNCIPKIDGFDDVGYTKEENKIRFETQKIFDDKDFKITATAVRVPVFNCHSESVNVEFEREVSLSEIREVLEKEKSLIVLDDLKKDLYPTPYIADGKDQVFVGRIRKDPTVNFGFNLFIVGDNLRKGAALNAMQICEIIIEKIVEFRQKALL